MAKGVAKNDGWKVRMILALGGRLPKDLVAVKTLLGLAGVEDLGER